MPAESEFQRRIESIGELLQRLDSAADPHIRSTAQELIQVVMELHGKTLERILETLHARGEEGQNIIDRLGHDDLVSSSLVLHGLHPLNVEDRVIQSLDKLRPSLKKRGGDVDVVQVTADSVKLKLRANSHAAALKELVEAAVYQAAPDVGSVEIEEPEEHQGFVPLSMLTGSSAAIGKGGL
jgi:Fe-S cluster biogenesis protein NfuA